MEFVGLLAIPAFVVGWILGRIDWAGERNYWRQRAQSKLPPALVVPAIPLGAQSAHVVIDAGHWPALEEGAGRSESR